MRANHCGAIERTVQYNPFHRFFPHPYPCSFFLFRYSTCTCIFLFQPITPRPVYYIV